MLGGLSKDLSEAGTEGGEDINKATSPLSSVESFISALTAPSTWLRLAEGVGGIVLFMVGLKTLTRGSGGGALQEASRQSHDVRDIAVAATLK